MATAPPSTNETGSAVPLTPATTPRIEKMPAPIMPPTPILTAAGKPRPLGVGAAAPAGCRRTLLILPHPRGTGDESVSRAPELQPSDCRRIQEKAVSPSEGSR